MRISRKSLPCAITCNATTPGSKLPDLVCIGAIRKNMSVKLSQHDSKREISAFSWNLSPMSTSDVDHSSRPVTMVIVLSVHSLKVLKLTIFASYPVRWKILFDLRFMAQYRWNTGMQICESVRYANSEGQLLTTKSFVTTFSFVRCLLPYISRNHAQVCKVTLISCCTSGGDDWFIIDSISQTALVAAFKSSSMREISSVLWILDP